MPAFIYALAWYHIIVILVMFGWLVYDVKKDKDTKWLCLPLMILVFFLYEAVTQIPGPRVNVWTVDFWVSLEPIRAVGKYVIIGTAYALVETFITFVNDRRYLKRQWVKFKEDNKKTFEDLETLNQQDEKEVRSRLYRDYVGVVARNTKFIKVSHSVDAKLTVSLYDYDIKNALADWISFWPAYAVLLVFGRFLEGFFTFLGVLVTKASQRVTNMLMNNVFK